MRRRRCRAAVALVAAVALAVAGCSGDTTPRAQPSAVATPPVPPAASGASAAPPGHVVVAIFENKAYEQVAGNSSAPYLSDLLARSAVFTDAHGVAHPSQPNYIALFSGSTQGVTDDHCPVRITGRPNLGRQLLDAGHTFAGYSESMPSAGYGGCSSGRYAAKHNPWVDFDNVPASANLPYTAWPADLATLPTVAFVVPDMCNDMHDCPVATGDAWAREHLDAYARWAATHDSWLVVTFDEDDGRAGNRILTLVTGAGVTPGPRTGFVDHYSVLRTIEDRYGLAPLGRAATATPLRLTG